MENREPIENDQVKAGAFKPNPTRDNRTNLGGTQKEEFEQEGGSERDEDLNFDTENNEPEINPGRLNNEEIDLDKSGPDVSPRQQANAQNNNQQGGDRGLDENSSGKSLLGQGGYGTSGTNGTNSGGNQGYQSGLGSAGSQNGSSGYNAGSQGMNKN